MDRNELKQSQLAQALELVGSQRRLTAAQIMTSAPTCIHPDTTALELVQMFHEKHFRHPLVTNEEGQLVGVISDRDVLRCFAPDGSPEQEALAQVKAGDLMSVDLVTISPSTPVLQVVKVMLDYGINCLPVVSGKVLLGIVTSTDLYLLLELLLTADLPALSARS